MLFISRLLVPMATGEGAYEPLPRWGHTSVTIGDRVYMWGGRTDDFSESMRKTVRGSSCSGLYVPAVSSCHTVKPPIKDTPKEDKSPNKGQAESTLYRKSPLKEDNLSTKDKTAGLKSVLIKRFHCIFDGDIKIQRLVQTTSPI